MEATKENDINQDLEEYIISQRKNFKFQYEEKGQLPLAKPKGSLKFVPIEQWSPEYHNSTIQYQPAPLHTFQEEENEEYLNEDLESESEESSTSISASEELESLLLDEMTIKTERRRQVNLERIGLYEKIMLETENIQKQIVLKVLENPNVDTNLSYRELLNMISNPEQKEQCAKAVANKVASYYAENDIDINWLKDNFVCQHEKDEFVNSVKQSLTFLDESLAQNDDLLVSYHYAENEFDLPKTLVKHPSLYASVISLLKAITSSRNMERLECDPKTLQPISKEASEQYFSEIQTCKQTILEQLDLLRVDDTVSCLVFQQSIDTSIDILLSLLYNFFQRRAAAYYRERIEISFFVLDKEVPLDSILYHCLYWVFMEFQSIQYTLVSLWQSVEDMFNDFNDFEYSDSEEREEDVEYDPRYPYENPFLGRDEELTDEDELEETEEVNNEEKIKEKIDRSKKEKQVVSKPYKGTTSSPLRKSKSEALPDEISPLSGLEEIESSAQKKNNNIQDSLDSSTKKKKTPKKSQEPTEIQEKEGSKNLSIKINLQDSEKKNTPSKKKELSLPYNIEFKTMLVFSKEFQKAILIEKKHTFSAIKRGDSLLTIFPILPQEFEQLEKSFESQSLECFSYLVGEENFIAIFNKTHNSSTLSKFTSFIKVQKKVYPILKLSHSPILYLFLNWFIPKKFHENLNVSFEERSLLAKKIMELQSKDLGEMLEIIKKGNPSIQNGEEIEIDIESLSPTTLREVMNFANQKLSGKKQVQSSTTPNQEIDQFMNRILLPEIPSLIKIDTVVTIYDQPVSLTTLMEEYYTYIFHWNPRVNEWKSDNTMKHRLLCPISATEMKNYQFYKNQKTPILVELTHKVVF